MNCKSFGDHVIIENDTALGILERQDLAHSGAVWQVWNGESWGDGESAELSVLRFTDYHVLPGLYLYRCTSGTTVQTSAVVKVGSDKIGWTFGNYRCEDAWGEVLTPDDLRFTYLWGVDFRASNGDIFTDDQIRFQISAALAEIERTLSYNFTKKIIKCESKDGDLEESGYRLKNHQGINIVQLRQVPVMSVERFDFYDYSDNKVANLLENIIVDKDKGVIELRPKGTCSFARTLDFGFFGGYSFRDSRFPVSSGYRNAFKVDYTVGLENAGQVPDDVRDIVGKIAACKLLNVIGDGLIAGFSSSSLSMDGLSESFSSTQSATSAYFGARIKVYEDNIAEWKKSNAKRFRKLYIGVL